MERQRSLRTLEAEFVQLKESALFLESVESTGVFLFRAPDLVRWDYRQPDPMVVLFAKDVVTTYHPSRRVPNGSRCRPSSDASCGCWPAPSRWTI